MSPAGTVTERRQYRSSATVASALLPGGGAVLQHMLGDLGRRGLGLDGDGAAADQGHDRRGAGLALGDDVVVGDDEPVATGQL